MMMAGTPVLAIARLAPLFLAAMGATPAAATTIAMTGVVPTRCEASFTGAPTATDARRIDLGLMTRSCNDGAGYRIILHTPGSIVGATFSIGDRHVPLSDTGTTVIVDSNHDERASEPAFIAFATPVPPGHFSLRLETVPKGPVY